MIKNFINLSIAVVAVAALPSVAQAGTATASGTATINVENQCTVAAKNIDLGTFSISDTWSNVGRQIGSLDNATLYFRAGSKGLEYVDYGTINCTAGTIFQISIKGTGPNGFVALKLGGNTGYLAPHLKAFDGKPVLDSPDAPTTGGVRVHLSSFLNKANGANQTLHGHMPMLYNGSLFLAPSEKLGVAGSFSDTLTYSFYF